MIKRRYLLLEGITWIGLSILIHWRFYTTTKSKDYYALSISKKALFPCNGEKLKCKFDLSDDDLKQAFSLPHSIAFEPM